jgi:DNA-directed RNA polymerase specialized sigma24 family protein
MVRDRGEAKGGPHLARGLALAVAGLIGGLAGPAAAQWLPGYPPPMPWPATEVDAAASAVLAASRDTRRAEAAAAAAKTPAPPAETAPASAPPPPATQTSAPAPEAPAAPASPTAPTATRSPDVALFDRLCTDTMRANEEDRLYGLISLTVRDTLGYNQIQITAPLVDEAVQDSLDDLIKDCPRLVTTDDAQRLGAVIDTILRATMARVLDREGTEHGRRLRIEQTASERSEARTMREIDRHLRRPPGRATAADLSQELSSWEIDAWLDGLAPKERALALFQYASDVTPQEVADAVGIPAAAMRRDSTLARDQLLSYYREDESGSLAPPAIPGPGPAIEYREAGTPLTGLLQASAPGGTVPGPVTVRINGISSELYAGWSLLAP